MSSRLLTHGERMALDGLSMDDARKVVVDVETCGNTLGDDGKAVGRILEVSMVELLDGKRLGKRLRWFCNPGHTSDEEQHPRAFEKHKLSVDFLKDHPTFAEQHAEIKAFIGTSRVIGHCCVFDKPHLPYDVACLNAESQRAGLAPLVPNNLAQDSNAVAKAVVPRVDFKESWRGSRRHYKLSDFAKVVLGQDTSAQAHSAEHDADCLAKVLVESYKRLREKAGNIGRSEERERSPRR